MVFRQRFEEPSEHFLGDVTTCGQIVLTVGQNFRLDNWYDSSLGEKQDDIRKSLLLSRTDDVSINRVNCNYICFLLRLRRIND